MSSFSPSSLLSSKLAVGCLSPDLESFSSSAPAIGPQRHMTIIVMAMPRMTMKLETTEIMIRPFMKEPPEIWYPSSLEANSSCFYQVSSLTPNSRSNLSPEAMVPALEKRQTVPMASQTKKLHKKISDVHDIVTLAAYWFFVERMKVVTAPTMARALAQKPHENQILKTLAMSTGYPSVMSTENYLAFLRTASRVFAEPSRSRTTQQLSGSGFLKVYLAKQIVRVTKIVSIMPVQTITIILCCFSFLA